MATMRRMTSTRCAKSSLNAWFATKSMAMRRKILEAMMKKTTWSSTDKKVAVIANKLRIIDLATVKTRMMMMRTRI